jgi:hypothetical protein
MPAVSPPATASIDSKPMARSISAAPMSISLRRARGNEISLRQSI